MARSDASFEGQEDLASLALTNLRTTINDHRVATKEIENPTRPLKTTEWSLPVIRLAGSQPLRNTPRLLRITKLPPPKYKTFETTITNGINRMARELPGGWGLWLFCLSKFAALTSSRCLKYTR